MTYPAPPSPLPPFSIGQNFGGCGGFVYYGYHDNSDEIQQDSELLVRCAACQKVIAGAYLLQVEGRSFHPDCLVCSHCNLPLEAAGVCYCREGGLFCGRDYFSLFGKSERNSSSCCYACGVRLEPGQLVMRARQHVYHPGCFACTRCGRQLRPGDKISLMDREILCYLHQHPSDTDKQQQRQQQRQQQQRQQQQRRPQKIKRENSKQENNIMAENSSQEVKPAFETDVSCASPLPDTPIEISETQQQQQQQRQQKRVRTSFKHQQLRAMKAHFILNHNPDSRELRQLALRTGLSKRVLQVWFQNARAKHRRGLARQQQLPANQDLSSDAIGSANHSPSQSVDCSEQARELTELSNASFGNSMAASAEVATLQ